MRTCFKRALIAVGLLGLTVALSVPAEAQGISKDQADAMLQELKQIRLLLQQMQRQNVTPVGGPTAPPAKVKVSLGGGPALGAETAPVTLVEFTDYQCPFCQKFQTETFEQLKKNYIDSGKLRFVSRDLPLPFHPHALEAAQAARCAGEQGKFWELRDVLISNGNKLSPETILDYAKGLSLDAVRFRQCFDSKKYQAEIQRDISEANGTGITGTPTFVLGKTAKDSIEGIKLDGAFPYTEFEARITELLKTN
jgi:protein-disulfide isomerase